MRALQSVHKNQLYNSNNTALTVYQKVAHTVPVDVAVLRKLGRHDHSRLKDARAQVARVLQNGTSRINDDIKHNKNNSVPVR